MASNRIGRINEEIQRELSSLFRTLKDPRVQSGMVTITHVDTTSDLRYSRIYVSVLEKSLEKDVIRGLKSAATCSKRASTSPSTITRATRASARRAVCIPSAPPAAKFSASSRRN